MGVFGQFESGFSFYSFFFLNFLNNYQFYIFMCGSELRNIFVEFAILFSDYELLHSTESSF